MKNLIQNLVKNRLDTILLAAFFLTALVNIIALASAPIFLRHNSSPHLHTHDNPIQTEEAIKFILDLKNPYTKNYLGTPLEKWPRWAGLNVNPSIYHVISLPFHILFSLPFYSISMLLLGWFDQRFVYIFSLSLFILLILKWPSKSLNFKFLFLAIFLTNPLFFPFFMEGRNDIFVFLWIALTIYFLKLKKYAYSAVALALAATSKQSAWFLLPFYFAYLFYNLPIKLNFQQKIKITFQKTKLFFAVAAIIIAPFLLWDSSSFVDDIIKYPSGTAYMSYPMNGSEYGFYNVVLKSGLAASPYDYWPFWIPQIIICLPLLYLLLKMQRKNNSTEQIIFNLSILLFAYWSFGRFFNDNYLGFLTMLFLFLIFIIDSRPKPKTDILPKKTFNKIFKK